MTTVTLRTRSRHAYALVAATGGTARIVGYAATEAAARPRERKLRAVTRPVEGGRVTVELHTCAGCGKPGGVYEFSGPGGICLECELAKGETR